MILFIMIKNYYFIFYNILDISFPVLTLTKNVILDRKLTFENYLYEELQKLNKIKEIENYCQEKKMKIKIREKIEMIEKDDIEEFKIMSNSNNFDFNQKLKKNNELYYYSRIPTLLYCIESNVIKCFKFALINGADPTLKSERFINLQFGKKEYQQIWDAYGFASAKGNVQIISILEERGIKNRNCLIEGCSKLLNSFRKRKVIF